MPPARRLGQRRRIGPARHHGAGRRPASSRPGGHFDLHRGQACGQRGLPGEFRVPGLAIGQLAQPVIVDQVRASDHAQRPGRHPGQVGQAFPIVRVAVQQPGRQDPLGQVIHPPPAVPAHADHLAHVQQPLHGDLRVRPVPPGTTRLGPAELGGVERALGPQPGQHLGAGRLVALVPAPAPGAQRAAAERVPRPLLQGEYAGRVGPVLEGGRLARMPVGPLDPVPRHRAEPGVGDELMGTGQHADGVQLHRAEPAEQRGHAAPAATGPEEALGTQREQPGLAGRQGQLGGWEDNAHHKTWSLTGGTDIPARLVAVFGQAGRRPDVRGRFSTSLRRCWWRRPAGRRSRSGPRRSRTATRWCRKRGKGRRPGSRA